MTYAAAIILWLAAGTGWVPVAGFPTADLCHAAAERAEAEHEVKIKAKCLPNGWEPTDGPGRIWEAAI